MATGGWGRLRAPGEILIVFLGMFVAATAIGLAVVPLLPGALAMPVQALGLWGAVAAGWLLLRRAGSSYASLGFRRPRSWRVTLGWAAAAVVAATVGAASLGALIEALTAWPPLDVDYIRTSIAGDPLAYAAWMLLVVWGSAGIGEELLARGFILDRLERLFGAGRAGLALAILGQALVFGLLHAIQGPAGIVITAWVGIVFALAWLASGRNLWAPIIAHVTVDTISLTLMFLELPLPGYID